MASFSSQIECLYLNIIMYLQYFCCKFTKIISVYFVCLLSCVSVSVLLLLFYTFKSKKERLSISLLTAFISFNDVLLLFFCSRLTPNTHTVSLHLPAVDLCPIFSTTLFVFCLSPLSFGSKTSS